MALKLNGALSDFDPDIASAIYRETARQELQLEMIASENYVSERVLEAQGSILTNKYAEGYPARRYYGGCEYVDIAEQLAIDRAKAIFGAEAANVQPHSGSQANMAVYLTLMQYGDVALGMDLSCGGHLTHGSPVSFSGKFFKFFHYGVSPSDQRIDFDQVRDLAKKHRPKVIIVGASAYPRTIPFATFREIADEVSARIVVDMAHIAGLVAAGVHPNPVPYAEFVTTTTHKTLRGPRGGLILSQKAYEKAVNSQIFPGIQGGPLMHVIAAKAVALREAQTEEFKQYAKQIVINARTLGEYLKAEGFQLVSGGTDNHLILVDLRNTELTGKDAEEILERAGMTVNKNTVPFETKKPFVTSGIRIGTPAITTRGMKEKELLQIGKFIVEALRRGRHEESLRKIRSQVEELSRAFPIYSHKLKS